MQIGILCLSQKAIPELFERLGTDINEVSRYLSFILACYVFGFLKGTVIWSILIYFGISILAAFLLWFMPSILAALSWKYFKKIPPIFYLFTILFQAATFQLYLLYLGCSYKEFHFNYLVDIDLSLIVMIPLYLNSVAASIWTTKQLFDVTDRDIAILIDLKINTKHPIIIIIFMMFIFYIPVSIMSNFIQYVYITLIYVRPVEIFKFIIFSYSIYIKFIPVILTLMFIANILRKKKFIRMVDATKIAIVISFSWLLLEACFSGFTTVTVSEIHTGVMLTDMIAAMCEVINVELYNAVCVIIVPISFAFWLTMKLTGTEAHVPEENR